MIAVPLIVVSIYYDLKDISKLSKQVENGIVLCSTVIAVSIIIQSNKPGRYI
jgi:hypothetical protein